MATNTHFNGKSQVGKKCKWSWTQWERGVNQGLTSTGNHRFTIPSLSQWEKIRRGWTQRERGDNLGFISTGNFKFRSVELDIFILNTYSAKPLSLSTGKKGQLGTHFNGKYIGKILILYFNRKLQVKLEVGVSGFMNILISNTYSARPLSLSIGKKGQPGTHFNGKYIGN